MIGIFYYKLNLMQYFGFVLKGKRITKDTLIPCAEKDSSRKMICHPLGHES